MESILGTIKANLEIDIDDTSFDKELVTHINTHLDTLTQLGIGNPDGFEITGYDENWEDFLTGHPRPKTLNNIKSYIYMRVKEVFDPPSSSAALNALINQADRLEWRIGCSVHDTNTTEDSNDKRT